MKLEKKTRNLVSKLNKVEEAYNIKEVMRNALKLLLVKFVVQKDIEGVDFKKHEK